MLQGIISVNEAIFYSGFS